MTKNLLLRKVMKNKNKVFQIVITTLATKKTAKAKMLFQNLINGIPVSKKIMRTTAARFSKKSFCQQKKRNRLGNNSNAGAGDLLCFR